jgi:prepilin peptidase CpaA
MSLSTTTAPVHSTGTIAPTEAGIDPEFGRQLMRVPLWALLWLLGAFLSHRVWHWFWPEGLNAGPLIVISFGMILAAIIDGVAFKVPNWITLPLILSGWLLGLCHTLDWPIDSGTGGLGISLLATLLGFGLLLPMLILRGVGEGDVKMQMAFAAWMGAYFGTGDTTVAAGMPIRLHALGVVFWGFVSGALFGGLFGLAMMLLRRRFRDNLQMCQSMAQDLLLLAQGQLYQAAVQAEQRRSQWVRLPYGIPLCVGFLFYLWLALIVLHHD